MTFRIVFPSILPVVLNVLSRETLWFRIPSSPLPGTATRELIRPDSLATFRLVNVTCPPFLKPKGPAMIVMARTFKLPVILVMIGVVFALALLFTFVVTKITLVFLSVVCNVL